MLTQERKERECFCFASPEGGILGAVGENACFAVNIFGTMESKMCHVGSPTKRDECTPVGNIDTYVLNAHGKEPGSCRSTDFGPLLALKFGFKFRRLVEVLALFPPPSVEKKSHSHAASLSSLGTSLFLAVV